MRRTIIVAIAVVALLALGMSTYGLVASPGYVVSEVPSLQVVSGPGEGQVTSRVKMETNQAGQIEKATIDADIQVDLIDPATGESLETRSIRVTGLDLTEAGDTSKSASQFFASTLDALDAQLSNVGLVLDQPTIENMEFVLNEAGSIISVPLQVNFRITVTSSASTGAVSDALKGKGHSLSSGAALYDSRVRYTLEGLAYTDLSPDVANMDSLVASIEAGVAATFPDRFN